ncbi:hypothetical protein AQUCO_09600039v1 [Aquilegia coerulea]|uniref:Cation-transporting P-type ATPase N-terminal domain-containing protein n=1 Tax=Aquilegia coerulea TaxID=218851 RepID=A0A2G5C4I4_AQUCA|nr:hypothetical protein AQUCO_09600039v1 [Aquilegia coerulea]
MSRRNLYRASIVTATRNSNIPVGITLILSFTKRSFTVSVVICLFTLRTQQKIMQKVHIKNKLLGRTICNLVKGIKEGWYDGGSIVFAVLLVIVVTAISDYRQSLHLEIIRGGKRVEVSIFDIVVGDIIPLKIGDQVHKDHRKDPFLMSGCKVADGYGTMLVTGVGINTEWGLLMASISEDTGEETPLQVRLNGVATFIGIVGLAVALVVLVVLLARYFTGRTREPNRFIKGKINVSDAVDGTIKFITVAVTIVVVAIPEGIPLAVTLTCCSISCTRNKD